MAPVPTYSSWSAHGTQHVVCCTLQKSASKRLSRREEKCCVPSCRIFQASKDLVTTEAGAKPSAGHLSMCGASKGARPTIRLRARYSRDGAICRASVVAISIMLMNSSAVVVCTVVVEMSFDDGKVMLRC